MKEVRILKIFPFKTGKIHKNRPSFKKPAGSKGWL